MIPVINVVWLQVLAPLLVWLDLQRVNEFIIIIFIILFILINSIIPIPMRNFLLLIIFISSIGTLVVMSGKNICCFVFALQAYLHVACIACVQRPSQTWKLFSWDDTTEWWNEALICHIINLLFNLFNHSPIYSFIFTLLICLTYKIIQVFIIFVYPLLISINHPTFV